VRAGGLTPGESRDAMLRLDIYRLFCPVRFGVVDLDS
jgi:hypothetical protein